MVCKLEAIIEHLTDQLRKIQIVNDTNKDFVVEALRLITEILTYGDHHDPSLFESIFSVNPLSFLLWHMLIFRK
ncbi:hypothetical protein Bca101_074557 [Brassica carinata]